MSVVNTCEECPDGASCPVDGASTQNKLFIDAGYWRISADATQIHDCPFPNACVGGANFSREGDGYCAEGYEGPLCAVCADVFFFDPDLEGFTSCDTERDLSQSWSIPIFIALCLVAVSVAVLVCCSSLMARSVDPKKVERKKAALLAKLNSAQARGQ